MIVTWPCTMDKLVRFDEFVGGMIGTISLVVVVASWLKMGGPK